MLRLTYYSATHSAGFRSGLGVKRVNLDLSLPERLSKNVFIISGNNATGKSVLSESLHPFTTNSGAGRQKFFVDGKEGLILREYLDDDGTQIFTRMVYTPKSAGGHNTKCFFSIQRPGEKEPTELNPTGNVGSYMNLVKTYFGITKDYVSFGSYSEAVKGIVTETSYDRKNKISSLIPNTSRFEVAYATINDKYKTTRTLARNVAQKMVHLRDEETIRGELRRCDTEIADTLAERERCIKKIAESKGKIQAIAGDDDVDKMIDKYEKRHAEILNLGSTATRLRARLEAACTSCGIDATDTEIEEFLAKEIKISRNLSQATMDRDNAQAKIDTARSYLNDIENEISEAESVIYSLWTQDTDELTDQLRLLNGKISDMQYAKAPEKYSDMNYNEIIAFMDQVEFIKGMVSSYLEHYGEIFAKYFSGETVDYNKTVSRINSIQQECDKLAERMAAITEANANLYQYRRLQTILSSRPSECKIDSCPFIRDALKWPEFEKQIESNDSEYDELSNKHKALCDEIENLTTLLQFNDDIARLTALVEKNEPMFKKYMSLTLQDIYKKFSIGTFPQEFSLDDIKRLGAILSEKELYLRITRVDIPEIEKMLELSKNADNSRKSLEKRIEKLKASRQKHLDTIDRCGMSIKIAKSAIKRHERMMEAIRDLRDVWDEALDAANRYEKLQNEYDALGESVEKIVALMNGITEHKKIVDECNIAMEALGPKRERLKYDLNQFNELTLEKALIEKDFALLDIMRQIVAPGKGVWGECIALYMDDIRATTNQLLLNMFDGNLYLDEFIITDKEFTIPYVYNGSRGEDVSVASSSQQAAISMALSLAIIAKMNGNYGVCVFDEADAPMSPANKEMFAEILIKQAKYIGLTQLFVVTHSPEIYSGYDVCRINFPGARKFEEDESIDILEGGK